MTDFLSLLLQINYYSFICCPWWFAVLLGGGFLLFLLMKIVDNNNNNYYKNNNNDINNNNNNEKDRFDWFHSYHLTIAPCFTTDVLAFVFKQDFCTLFFTSKNSNLVQCFAPVDLYKVKKDTRKVEQTYLLLVHRT